MHSLEVRYLSGVHFRHVPKRLPGCVQSPDYYLPLLFHMDTIDTAKSSLKSIKKDYRALGVVLRDPGAQVVFSTNIPVKWKRFERAIEPGESTNGPRTGATTRG